MDRAAIAERFLLAVTTRARAREMIGDLLETHADTGAISFWRAFVRLFLSFAWRPSLALLIAAIAGFSSSFELSYMAARRLFFGQVHSPILFIHAMLYARVSAPLWTLAVFALLRFGVRDRLWMVSAAYACLTTGFVYSFWMPQGRPVLWIGLGAVIVLSLSTDIMRRASGVIAAALALGLASESFLGYTVSRAIHHHLVPVSLITPFALFLILAVPLIEAATCSALHRRLIA